MSTRLAIALATASLLAAACGDVTPDPDTIAADLELENGGLDTTDEAPQFGDPAFDEAALEPDGAVTDALDGDVEVEQLRQHPGAFHFRVLVVWGQLPPDRTTPTPRDWDGGIAISNGALVVRRTIGFEDTTDLVAPREVRTAVRFRSTTRPFADGLALEVLTSGPLASTVLAYRSADGTTMIEVPLSQLVQGPVSTDVDALGNRMVMTVVHHHDACETGFMRGRWQQVRPGLGRFVGVVNDDDGDPIGHLRGIWGTRASGERVFFAKYIANDGTFRGLFAGHHGDGELAGRWIVSTGDHGRAQGRYRESLPGPDVGGHFLGRWAETSCSTGFPADE